MLIVVRNDENLSPKAKFTVHLINQNFNNNVFYVFKRDGTKFTEKWSCDQVQLPSSTMGLILHYLLMMLKNPRDFRNGILVRLSRINRKHVFTEKGFLSILSSALYLRYGTSAQDSELMQFLNKLASPRLFLVDEFISLGCLNLKKIKLLGPIIYVSQDISYNRFGFGDNSITRKLLLNLERDAIADVDLVVACSEMERLKYLQIGAKNTTFYPNIYPTKEFRPDNKDQMPSISIVVRGHWGLRAEKSLEEIFDAFAYFNRQIRVYVIGIRPKTVPKFVKLEYSEFIKDKMDYLRVLSKSWIGINIGIHKAGTNERKYDYAEAGTVVLSDTLGARGDFLPHEYTYVDSHDLAAKIEQLLEFGKARLTEMGNKNRTHVLSMAEKQRQKMLHDLSKLISKFGSG
jgi:hypothetical protein